jgi:hypothetical protein
MRRTCYHWLEEGEQREMLIRYIRKRPLSTAAIFVLAVWLVVLIFVGSRTIDLDAELVVFVTTSIPTLSVRDVTEQAGEGFIFNLETPHVAKKRAKLLRNWLLNGDDEKEIQPKILHSDSDAYAKKSKHSLKLMRKLKNIANISSHTALDRNVTSLRNHTIDTPLFIHHVNLTLIRNHTTNTSSLYIHQVNYANNASLETRKNLTETRFKLTKLDFSEIKNLYKPKPGLHGEENIPSNLQKEIGPISKYNDTVKTDERNALQRKFKFNLDSMEKNILTRRNWRPYREADMDRTNPENVRNAIGPVADYGTENEQVVHQVARLSDWMEYFGRRENDLIDSWEN